MLPNGHAINPVLMAVEENMFYRQKSPTDAAIPATAKTTSASSRAKPALGARWRRMSVWSLLLTLILVFFTLNLIQRDASGPPWLFKEAEETLWEKYWDGAGSLLKDGPAKQTLISDNLLKKGFVGSVLLRHRVIEFRRPPVCFLTTCLRF
jgi:hypothetical protein